MTRQRRPIVALLLAAVALMMFPGSAAADNNYLHCGEVFTHYRWTPTTVSYSRPSGWADSYKTAIDDAADDYTSNTLFARDRVSSGIAVWTNVGDTDNIGLAGQAMLTLNPTTCRITDVELQFNFPHYDPSRGGASHAVGEKKCTAVHEYGHAVGLSHLGSVATSVMATPHDYRCHDILTKTLQEDDIDDINGLH